MEFEKIRAIICEGFDIDEGEVELETHLEDLNFDSLDMVEIVMDIEDEFNVEVPDEVVEKFVTIGDIVRFLENCWYFQADVWAPPFWFGVIECMYKNIIFDMGNVLILFHPEKTFSKYLDKADVEQILDAFYRSGAFRDCDRGIRTYAEVIDNGIAMEVWVKRPGQMEDVNLYYIFPADGMVIEYWGELWKN